MRKILLDTTLVQASYCSSRLTRIPIVRILLTSKTRARAAKKKERERLPQSCFLALGQSLSLLSDLSLLSTAGTIFRGKRRNAVCFLRYQSSSKNRLWLGAENGKATFCRAVCFSGRDGEQTCLSERTGSPRKRDLAWVAVLGFAGLKNRS